MNIMQHYVEYLKDNPEGYWFKCKLYGWGWTPARWQGWLVTLTAVVAIVFIVLRAEQLSETEVAKEMLLPVIGIVAVLIVISYWKGEPPRWQWGLSSRGEDNKQVTGTRPFDTDSERSE